MNHNTIFTVKNSDLDRLNPHTAVDFFRKLLWAEARRIGVEISKIHVSSAIHVADGGIDAAVDDAQIDTGCGIIKPGNTSYQIKSGEFKPWQPSFTKKALFLDGIPDQENLGRSIRCCLDAGGTYILVCTGIDLVESHRIDAIEHIKKYLKKCGYPNAKVEVWSQNNLIGFLDLFPSLALVVNENDTGTFQTHRSWSRDEDMDVQFVPGQTQTKLIANIQAQLRRDDDTVHVRVLGEPGIGKTKVVLEATRTDDISPLVIYCTAAQFRDSYLMNQILRDDNKFSVVLVIDECDADSRYYIWNKLRHRGSRIKLVTIYNDHDPNSDRGISEFEISDLEDEQIRAIIQGYNVSNEQADRYIEFSGGSPRMAHHVGRTLESYPGDPSQLLTDDYLYERFYIDIRKKNLDRQEIEQRESVLHYIALFKKFGFERSVVTEAQAIANKVEADDSLIGWGKFQKTIDHLRKRKILQGEFTLYLTPKALHIKLWTEWWRIHGNSFDLLEFTQDLPPKLIEWFYEMFIYAAESETASQIVKDLLGPNGPFRNDENLKTKLGSGFFLALAEANPKSALECLRCTVGTWDKEFLLQFKEGRREVVIALQKIAVWCDLFADAARLLLTLAEAENEGFSNNASGVFAELFSPGPGRVAPTEAPLSRRLPILEEAFTSGSKERCALALKACNVALEATHFVRIGSPEHQGLRQQPDMWKPTHGELWDAYKAVWKLLEDQLPRLPEDERKEGAEILLVRARGLTRIQNLSNMVVDTVASIAKNKYVNEKHVIETISRILHYEGKNLDPTTQKRWEQLMGELVGSDFHSKMQRYVGLDLLEDKFDENRNHFDQAQPRIEELAQQAVNTPFLLQSELIWLVTEEAKKGYDFGYQVGKRDKGFTLLSELLDAQRRASENASAYFLGGYLRALFETDPSRWEAQLDALINDAELRLWIPELTCRSGLTDRAGLRILDLAITRNISVHHFEFFAYGQAIKSLSDEVFNQWIAFLLSVTDKSSVALALNFFHTYHVFQKPKPTLPFELTYLLITHPVLFKEGDGSRIDSTMTDYYWAEISKEFLQLYPEKNMELAQLMLSHFSEDGSIINRYSQTCSVLDEIMEKCPAEIWEQVCEHLESHEYSSKKFVLEQWLKEGSSCGQEDSRPPLLYVPHELIWKWIDEDIEYRAWYLAERLAPKTLSTKEWEGSIVRGLLFRYGEREKVRSSLRANYYTETYWGPESLHYEEKRQKLLDIRNCEDNRNVIQWIDEFVEELEGDIERAKIDEERQF